MPLAVPSVWRPSTARSVTLDAELPLPRGVLPSDLPALSWPAKDPGDVLDYELDASAALAGDRTDQIATVAVTVTPNAAAADVQVGRAVADGAVAVVWLSGGQAGTVYAVQVTIGTRNGRIIGRSVLLPVQSLSGLTPPAAPLQADSGTIITDQNGNPILVGG